MRQFPKAKRAFYEVKAAADAGTTDIFIYDVIGDDWLEPSLTAKALVQRIADIDTPEINLHLNSPGGSVPDGIAIYNALMTHPAKVTATVEGWTASVATVIAMSAEHVQMYANTMFVIHNPWGIAVGNASDMRKYADMLDMVTGQVRDIYMQRVTKSEDELTAALDAETYLDAEMAAEWGFVDEVMPATFAAAACSVDTLESLGFDHVKDVVLEPCETTDDDGEAGGSPVEPQAQQGGSPERTFLAGGTLITLTDQGD